MSEIQSLINLPCRLLHRGDGEETEFGVPDDDGDEVETVCYLEQRNRTEDRDQGEASEADWLAVFKVGEEVDTADAIVVSGSVYEFVGQPARVWDPERRRYSHIEATVRYTGTEEETS